MVISLSIGRNIWTKKPVYFYEKMSYGVTLICAKARYGKSILNNILLSKMSKLRKIILFDFRGEHLLNQYANFLSNDSIQCIEKMRVIENFAFKVSDLTHAQHWTSLRFTESAATILCELAKTIYAHSLTEFIEVIKYLDFCNGSNSYQFFGKFPALKDVIPSKIHQTTVENLQKWFMSLVSSNFFMKDEDTRVHIQDWYQLLQDDRNYLINMNLGDSSAHFGRLMVGLILESFQSNNCKHLMESKPCFIFEEADLLFPTITEDTLPMSNKYIDLYVLKYQKYKVECIFIIQDFEKLHNPIVTNTQTFIFGQCRMPSYVNIYGVSQSSINRLKWKPLENYRQFMIVSDGNLPIVFEPEDSCCVSNGLKENTDRISEQSKLNVLTVL